MLIAGGRFIDPERPLVLLTLGDVSKSLEVHQWY